MQDILIYSKDYCPYCHRAIELLKIKAVNFVTIDVTEDSAQEVIMRQRSGRSTVPQIFIGDQHIGGCDELFALDEMGQLDPLLLRVGS